MKKESSPTPVFTAPESEPPVYNTAPMEDPDERQQQYTISTKPKRMSTWDAWKLALRVMDVVFTVVNLMLIGVLVGLGDWSSGIVVILVAFPAAAVGLFWHLAEFVTLIVCRGEIGIHPGAHVGMHLLTSGLWISATAVSAATGSVYMYYPIGWSGGQYAAEVLPWVIIGFFSLNMLCNFVLFGLACRETDVLNKEKRRLKASMARKVSDLDM